MSASTRPSDFASRLNISVPIIQAPMAGGGDTAELVAAVCNAGGLGSIGAAYLTPEQIIERGHAVRSLTASPFAINLFSPSPVSEVTEEEEQRAIRALVPYYEQLGVTPPARNAPPRTSFEDQLAAALECGAEVFSFTFGLLPESSVREIRRRDKYLIGTATTVSEAEALVQLGVDAVVAQGSEAGGHRGTFMANANGAIDFTAGMIGTMALVPQIVDAVRVPVIASGGIMDGRGIAAALALGASAVQLGTAFLTCEEAGVATAYKEAILSATEDQTRITLAFSGRPARGVTNRVVRDLEEQQDAILPFPLQNSLTRPMRNESAQQNRSDYLSLWAGQGVRLARRTTAAELIQRLQRETEEAIRTISSLVTQTPVGEQRTRRRA